MDLLIATALFLGSVIVGIACNLIASELYDRTRPTARWIIGRSVGRLPQRDQKRYAEEWLSHLNDCTSGFGALIHAIGCLRASSDLNVLKVQRQWLDLDKIVRSSSLSTNYFWTRLHRRSWAKVAMNVMFYERRIKSGKFELKDGTFFNWGKRMRNAETLFARHQTIRRLIKLSRSRR